MDRYRSESPDGETNGQALSREHEVVHPDVKILDVEMRNAQGEPETAFRTGDVAVLRIRYGARRTIEAPVFNVGLLDAGGAQITAWRSDQAARQEPNLEPGVGSISLAVEALNLLPGNYRLSVRLWRERVLGEMYCSWEGRTGFQILGGFDCVGVCYLPHRWGAVEMETRATEHEDPAPQ
jgi:hypothetical protein